MPNHGFADIPPITDFESCQRLRPVILLRLGNLMEVWRGRTNAACVRARSCRRSDWACLTAFMQTLPDEQLRLFRYALEYRHDGLDPDAAIARALARVAEESADCGG